MWAKWNSFKKWVGNSVRWLKNISSRGINAIRNNTGKWLLNGIKNISSKGLDSIRNNTGKVLIAWALAGNIIPSWYRMPIGYISWNNFLPRMHDHKITDIKVNDTAYNKIKTDEFIKNYFEENDIDFEGLDMQTPLWGIGIWNKNRDMRYSQIASVLVDFTTNQKINITSTKDLKRLLEIFYKSGRNPTKRLTILPGRSPTSNTYDFGAYNIPTDDNGIDKTKMIETLDQKILTRTLQKNIPTTKEITNPSNNNLPTNTKDYSLTK